MKTFRYLAFISNTGFKLRKSFKIGLFSLVTFLILPDAGAQELFVATEPASNAPKNSVRLRLSNEGVSEADFKSRTSLGILDGLTKDLMLNVNAYTPIFIRESSTLMGIRFT